MRSLTKASLESHPPMSCTPLKGCLRHQEILPEANERVEEFTIRIKYRMEIAIGDNDNGVGGSSLKTIPTNDFSDLCRKDLESDVFIELSHLMVIYFILCSSSLVL
ncbi:hypothetical protein AWENTII_003865 [Aspergillus wentii]